MGKKLIIIIGICTLIPVMPASTSISLQMVQNLKTQLPSDNEFISIIDCPPNWAQGNFSGEWGISFLGFPLLPLGWIKGYYGTIGVIGRIEGVFREYNKSEITQIGAYIIGYFLLGIVGNESTGNWTYCVGLGGVDNANLEFYFNIHLIVGPGFYMQGIYSEFDK